jgi:5-methylcytosine-specific restriction protein A
VFPLSPSEASALYGLVVRRNPECAGLWSEFGARSEVEIAPDLDEMPPGGTEGRRRLVRHFIRERNRVLAQAKRAIANTKASGLACEVCGFDFGARYGVLGRGFCEVHHRVALGAAKRVRRTSLADLAIVCSNCHRMIHRGGTIRTIAEVRRNLKGG